MSESETRERLNYAAVDLGSNSFHMVIARLEGESLHLIDRLRDSVRLGSGLDENKNIDDDTWKRAFICLSQFEQRLRGIPRSQIRIVGTNTLRRANNTIQFNNEIQELFNKGMDIISGREEARLIFSAVAHGLPNPETKRLVIDIGGGSTELIAGTGFQPKIMESTNMGCVSFSNQFFRSGKIEEASLKSAILHAELELQPILRAYKDEGWEEVIGCSGTIKATEKALIELGLVDESITRESLKQLCDIMMTSGNFASLKLSSINESRIKVIVGGIAVLYGLMRSLDIDRIKVSQVALREGVIYDMIGKVEHDCIQDKTIVELLTRYRADETQSRRVSSTAGKLFSAVHKSWKLDPELDLNTLTRASQLHEIGLSLAHQQYHKHGAYILNNSDMLGFSRIEQTELGLLVRYHRRKLDVKPFQELGKKKAEKTLRLLALLRIAALFHRDRYTHQMPKIKLAIKKSELRISIPQEWMEAHPLTTVELVEETNHLKPTNIKLVILPL